MATQSANDPTYDDALAEALGQLRFKAQNAGYARFQHESFDFDAYVAGLQWAKELKLDESDDNAKGKRIAALMLEVAWELVRRGILRPGTRTVPDSNMSNPAGFCLTRPGRDWLIAAHEEHFSIMLSKSLIRTFAEFRSLFGQA